MFIVLEAGSLRLWAWLGWARAVFWVTDFLLYLHMVVGARELSEAFCKGTNPIQMSSTLMNLLLSEVHTYE